MKRIKLFEEFINESSLVLNWGMGFDGKMVEFETDEKELKKLQSMVPLLTELGESFGVLRAEIDNEKARIKDKMKAPRGDSEKFNLKKEHKEEISRLTKEKNAAERESYRLRNSFSKNLFLIAGYYFNAANNKKYAETIIDLKAKERALDYEESDRKSIEKVLQTAKPKNESNKSYEI
jgi:hypothetical protein